MTAILCTLIAMGLKFLSICWKICVFQLFRKLKRPFAIVLCEESPYDLVYVLGPVRVILQLHEIFIKLNLPILLELVRPREKSQKCVDLSALNWNFNHANLLCALDATIFLKWDFFWLTRYF